MSDVILAGSLLSADLSNVRGEFEKFTKWGLEVMHIDVMDGHFAPNLTFGPDVFKGVSGEVEMAVDIHMMVEKPMDYAQRFAEIFNVGEYESGRNWYGVHVEIYFSEDGVLNVEALKKDLIEISELGFLTTVVVNPETEVDFLDGFLAEGLVDKILVMTVWPGFSGQELIESCLDTVRRVRSMVGNSGVLVAVDGGVNESTFEVVVAAGADFVVSGSWLMGMNKNDFMRRI
jgi:ribulose-phosphate 3-epimerase